MTPRLITLLLHAFLQFCPRQRQNRQLGRLSLLLLLPIFVAPAGTSRIDDDGAVYDLGERLEVRRREEKNVWGDCLPEGEVEVWEGEGERRLFCRRGG